MLHDNRIVGVFKPELIHAWFLRSAIAKHNKQLRQLLSDRPPRRFARRVGQDNVALLHHRSA